MEPIMAERKATNTSSTVAALAVGDRVLVTRDRTKRKAGAEGPAAYPQLYVSRVKTGARVATVKRISSGSYHVGTRVQRRYEVETDLGTLRELAPALTVMVEPDTSQEDQERAEWHAAHPHAVIQDCDRPTSSHPEPGWMSQCRNPRCPGHWRTGLETEQEARAAYEVHLCAHQEPVLDGAAGPEEELVEATLIVEELEAQESLSPSMEAALIVALRDTLYRATPGRICGALRERGLVDERRELTETGKAVARQLWDALSPGRCPNRWHETGPARAAQRCPECPPEHAGRCSTSPGLIHCQVLIPGGEGRRCGRVLPGQDEARWLRAQFPDATPERQEEILTELARLGTVLYPEGTPQHEEYARQLQVELDRWSRREPPYGEAELTEPDPDAVEDSIRQAQERQVVGIPEPAPRADCADPECAERARVKVGQVVHIHNGTRLWEVLEVVKDGSVDQLTGRVTDHTMARLACLDPDGPEGAQWTGVDLLHVHGVDAVVATKPVLGGVIERATPATFSVTGGGWENVQGRVRVIQEVNRDRATYLAQANDPIAWEDPRILDYPIIPALRVGSAIRVDGQLYRLEDLGDGWGMPALIPIDQL